MADAKPPESKTPAAGGLVLPPEIDLANKIKAHQEQIAALQKEIRTMHGRSKIADPKIIEHFKKENEALRARLPALQKNLLALMMESIRPKQPKDEKLHDEAMVRAVLAYCKKAEVDKDLWKSLES